MVGNLGDCCGAGHQVQFLQSHQNLKHSNLLEDSLENSDRIFKGAAVPDRTGQDTGMLLHISRQWLFQEVVWIPGVTALTMSRYLG